MFAFKSLLVNNMDEGKHYQLIKSSQSDRNEDEGSKEANPLALEYHMIKATDEISHLLPSETEERIISQSMSEYKESEVAYESKEILIKSEEKLDVDKTSLLDLNEEFEGMEKNQIGRETYKKFSDVLDEPSSASERKEEISPIIDHSIQKIEAPRKDASADKNDIIEEEKYHKDSNISNDFEAKSKEEVRTEENALKNILGTEIKLDITKEIEKKVEDENSYEKGKHSGESQDKDRAGKDEEEKINEELSEKPAIKIQKIPANQDVKEKDAETVPNKKINQANGNNLNLIEVKNNTTSSKSRTSSISSNSNKKLISDQNKDFKNINKSREESRQSVNKEYKLEKSVDNNKKILNTKQLSPSKPKESAHKQEINTIKENKRKEVRDIKQDKDKEQEKPNKPRLEKNMLDEKEIKQNKNHKSEKSQSTKPLSKTTGENYHDEIIDLKQSSRKNEIPKEKENPSEIFANKANQSEFNETDDKLNNTENDSHVEIEIKSIEQERPKLIYPNDTEEGSKRESHQKSPKSKPIEKADQACQTDSTSLEKSLQDKINYYEKLIKNQSKELEGLREKLAIKSNEAQTLNFINEKNTEKIQKLKDKIGRTSEDVKRLFDISEEKDYEINRLRGKEVIIESVRAVPAVQQKKNAISEADFWQLNEIEERNKAELVSLRDVVKNKSLWISHMEDKRNPLDFSDKIHSKVPESSTINKNYDFIKKLPTNSKLKNVRRSLEPLTPISIFKS